MSRTSLVVKSCKMASGKNGSRYRYVSLSKLIVGIRTVNASRSCAAGSAVRVFRQVVHHRNLRETIRGVW